MKKARVLSILLVVVLLAVAVIAAQPPEQKVYRIGVLRSDTPSIFATRNEAFRQGLHELGYVEGKNIVIEYRYAEGKLDRLPLLAAELVDHKIDVIVTGGNQATLAASKRPAPSQSLSDPLATLSSLESSLAWLTLAGMSLGQRASLRILGGSD